MQKQCRCALFTFPFPPAIYCVNETCLLMLNVVAGEALEKGQLGCWLHLEDLTVRSSLK